MTTRGRIKGWRKSTDRRWVGKNGKVINITQRQDRDGRNAFLYGANIYNYKSLGTGRRTKKLFREIRNENLLRKKISKYMRSNPKG